MSIVMEVNKKEEGLIKISASSTKTYTQCPKKYWFRYIDRAPTKEWRHFSLGNLCHKTLEYFHREYRKHGFSNYNSLPEIMGAAFSAARLEEKAANDVEDEAKGLLVDYLKSLGGQVPNVKKEEQDFKIHLREDVLLRGFIDRVDLMPNGKAHIVDYKTSKNPKYLDPDQLMLYGLWLIEKFPKIKEYRGSYVLLRHGSKYKSYDINLADLDKIKKKAIEVADKIKYSKNKDQWVAIPGPLCSPWCDFNDICPALGW